MQKKDFTFKIKSIDPENGTFSGLGAVYNNVDQGNDVILPGAFKRTLQANVTFPILWQHNTDSPIGSAKATDTQAGLQVVGTLELEDPTAQKAYRFMKSGIVKGLSIGYESHAKGDQRAGHHPWELYDLNTDYSQAHDLARKYPKKLNQMIQLFDEEAKRNQVYPLRPKAIPLPSPAEGKKVFIYRSGVDRLPDQILPQMVGHPHEITADIITGPAMAQGVIVTQGGRYGGFSLFVKGGHVIYEVNAFGNLAGKLVSRDALQPGSAHIVLSLQPDMETGPQNFRPGTATLQINSVSEGKARFANLVGKQHGETFDIGKDLGTAVSADYQVPYPFNGVIEQVKVELK